MPPKPKPKPDEEEEKPKRPPPDTSWTRGRKVRQIMHALTRRK